VGGICRAGQRIFGLTCPKGFLNIDSVMNKEQQFVDLLNKACKKVKLLDHNDLTLCRCLIKDQKVIDIYLTESEAIASYIEVDTLECVEDSYTFDYINENVLNKLFNRVASADQYINTLRNKQHVEELQEFLK
jgi:hypothetical protein